jgi:hypothetical protein
MAVSILIRTDIIFSLPQLKRHLFLTRTTMVPAFVLIITSIFCLIASIFSLLRKLKTLNSGNKLNNVVFQREKKKAFIFFFRRFSKYD